MQCKHFWSWILISSVMCLLWFTFSIVSGEDAPYEEISERVEVEEINKESIEEDESVEESSASFLNIPYMILHWSDETLIYLGRNLLSREVREAFKGSYGHLSPSFFLLTNLIFLSFIIYFSLSFLFVGRTDKNWSQLSDIIPKVQSNIRKSNEDKNFLKEKLASLQDELKEKLKENEKNSLEEEELKMKLHEVVKERDEVIEKIEILVRDLSEETLELEEHQRDKSSIHKLNESTKKDLSQSTKKCKILERELKQKEKELERTKWETRSLEGKIKDLKISSTNLHLEKDEVYRNTKETSEKAKELEIEKKFLSKEETKVMANLEHINQEVTILRQCYQDLKSFQGNDDLDKDSKNYESLLDENKDKIKECINVAMADEKMKSIEIERDSIKFAVAFEEDNRRSLEGEIQKRKHDLDEVAVSRQEADKLLQAISLKMEVLSDYFREKERELTKLLQHSEERDSQAVGGCLMSEEKIKQLEDLACQYKIQLEELQQEIQNVEANYRKEVAAQERRAHESWLSYRQSEKEVKEAQQEIDNLRMKLSELRDKLDKAYEAEEKIRISQSLEGRMPLPRPHPMMPFPRLSFPPSFFPPLARMPPNFRPMPPLDHDGNPLRSTPPSHLERFPPPRNKSFSTSEPNPPLAGGRNAKYSPEMHP